MIDIKNTRNLKHLLFTILEALIALSTGAYFFFNGKQDVGILLGLFGIYLVINRIISLFIVEEIFKETEDKIAQIAKIEDLRNDSHIELISNVWLIRKTLKFSDYIKI